MASKRKKQKQAVEEEIMVWANSPEGAAAALDSVRDVECQSVFKQGRCLHGCEGQHEENEEHECECGYTWKDEEAEDA